MVQEHTVRFTYLSCIRKVKKSSASWMMPQNLLEQWLKVFLY